MDYRLFKNTYVREIDGKALQVDKDMVNDCLAHYSQFDDLEDAIVMDWGANIGGFGRMLMDKPIKRYIGVECHPENFEVMEKNLGDDLRFALIEAAVTNQDAGNIDLYMTGSKQEFCSGTTNPKSNAAKNMRKKKVSVATVNGYRLLEKYKPTHLKCDIEGEEYRMFDPDWLIPDSVKQLSLEFHWADRILSDYESTVRESLIRQGFTPVQEKLNYVKGDKRVMFLGEDISYRNVWGLDTLYKR
tara:strand:- start:6197 stop:6928 length:732 start_codon:yes stop_codon:yes gene_type:complete